MSHSPASSLQAASKGAPQDHGLPQVSGDAVEQEDGEKLDNIVPTHGYQMMPVIGLGGSAGGLSALQAFFKAAPARSGMAYVVIMHLSAEHESILAELLQRTTVMPVRQVEDQVKVEADHIYVIPPAKNLMMVDGDLRLSEPARPKDSGKHVAVDLFFRTLADTHGPHAAAIVLSGADGDGAIGIKRIKERGGLTIAQDPSEAEHGGMPRSALATGMVDWVLPVAEMPQRILDYWRTERLIGLPIEERLPSSPDEDNQDDSSQSEGVLREILTFLRGRTGRDFTYYKRATVLRRIARRMQVNGMPDEQEYLNFLRMHAGEAAALLQDLLISVTNFFRDREAFAALELGIPALFRGKGPQDTVRVWVAACATGEEAYSVAMLLCEHAAKLEESPLIQVFATDLDENAIQIAREGAYAQTISADVSEERLRRFFTKSHGRYRVKRELRETVLFALHDLLKDSPFSRLDLVTCRNLLIYLSREAQARALEVFHFSLRQDGMLFLGTAESVDDDSALFAPANKKYRIYARLTAARSLVPTPLAVPGAAERALLNGEKMEKTVPTGMLPAGPRPSGGKLEPAAETQPPSWGELHSRLLEQHGPPSVIVNQLHEVVHLSGNAGRFMQLGNGEPTMNLVRVVHPMLRIDVRAALFRAAQSGVAVETNGIPVEIDGEARAVDIRVVPALATAPDALLVLFRERETSFASFGPHVVTPESEPAVRQLEREIDHVKTQLRDTVEQSEAATEELKASNEELQAMNEELRSATEELETGREELQSINEELTTVNQEMKSKVEELGRSNSDLQNLMASTAIATIFLDRQLCIQRYTPPAVALFNLIPSDLGRPLSDLVPQLNYPDLTAEAERVLDQLAVSEREVDQSDGRYFLAHMSPYRTDQDQIAGVVLTFVDITQRRRAEEELRASEMRFRAVSDLVPDLLFSTDPAGQLLWCNQRFIAYTGHNLAQNQGRGWVEAIHPEDRARAREAFLQAVERGESYRNEHRLVGADEVARWFLVRAEPLRDATGRIVQWFGAKTDIDDVKRAGAALGASEERLRLIIENAREFAIFSMDLDLRVTSWNSGAERLLGYAEADILDHGVATIFTPEDRSAGAPAEEARTALQKGRAIDERWHQRRDGSRFWANGAMMRMNDTRGAAVGFVKILRDETEGRQTRQALEQGREDLWAALQENERARAEAEAAGKAKDHFLAVLSHELRTPLTPVLMAAHMLMRNPKLPANIREVLEMIERNVKVEAHFIDDLLDLTRITQGKIEVVREPLDLHQAVQHAVEISKPDLENKQQKLTVKLEARAHGLSGDATRLQQVFWNLLKNASKFTPDGGSIHVASRNGPGRIVVEVSDDGIGFEADAIDRIFDAFAQASHEVTRRFGGLGLGLAISKATVDAHQGSLTARSAGNNQGATFIVDLPLSMEKPVA